MVKNLEEKLAQYDSALIRRLKTLGYRITRARLRIIGCIEDMKHFKMEDVVAMHLDRYKEDLNHQSLYNIINLLVELDVVKKRYLSDDGSYYEVVDSDHIHIYKNSGEEKRHFEKSADLGKDIRDILSSKYNIDVARIDLEIKIK